MKKIVRMLFLTTAVVTVVSISQAYAGGNNPKSNSDRNWLSELLHDIFGGDDHDHNKNQGNNNNNSGNSGNQGSNSGTRAPLDGGLSVLLVAGAGLGVKKAVQRHKARKAAKADISE
ncbi:MAG TPA: hypothetical protein VGM30_01125 [Puia sp.]